MMRQSPDRNHRSASGRVVWSPIYDCRRSCFRTRRGGRRDFTLVAPRSAMTRSTLQRVHIVDSDLSMSRSTQSTGLGTWPHSPAPNRGNDLSEYPGKDAREIGQPEFHMENDEQDTDKTTPDPHFEKLPGICDHRGREEQGRRHTNRLFAKGHIFKDGLIGKSTKPFEESPPHEEGLIPVENMAPRTTNIVEKRNYSVSRVLLRPVGELAGRKRVRRSE